MKKILFLLSITALIASCSEDSKEVVEDIVAYEDTLDVAEIEITYPEDIKFNDLAMYIAGRTGRDSSIYKELENESSWKSFQTSLDVLWKNTNNKLPVIKEWSADQLKDIHEEGGTLFYPFAGADFLHAQLFFPTHDNIALFALEPIGNFPDLYRKEKDTTLGEYLDQLKTSMKAILGLSFFRTVAMADDFQSELDGTLHVLMHFMARTDHEVLYQEKVAILPNGDLSNDLSSISDSTYIGNRFYYRKTGEEKVRTLTYFACNIQNTPYGSRGGLLAKGLETRKDLVAFIEKLDINSTYLKSASYLLHRPSFSIIRDIILTKSKHIIQDDSGIPLQFFDDKWDLTFYGNFEKPIRLFSDRQQEDLKEAYDNEDNDVRPLPFGIGYQFQKGSSNMMRATRKSN